MPAKVTARYKARFMADSGRNYASCGMVKQMKIDRNADG
jgi:hypothetical protein